MTRVDIIAEVAQGYEGDPSLARKFVGAAAGAGADLVKFQMVYAEELATPSYAHYALFSKLEMSDDDWRAVAREAEALGIGLAFDVFGPRSLALALACGARAVKVHSTDFFNHALVGEAVKRAPRVYFSIGGIEPREVTDFLERHRAAAARLTMMFGFQAEPTPIQSNHLSRLAAWRARFPDLAFGFMDHADGGGDEASWLGVLALPFGIGAIEKHLTLDRALQLEDFVSALAPPEFARYVARVRAAEAALGSGALELTEAERAYRRRALRVVVAARALGAGTVVAGRDVVLLRTALPAERQPIYTVESAVGRRLREGVAQGEAMCEEMLE